MTPRLPSRPSFLPSVLQRTFIFGSFAPKSQRDVLSFLFFRPKPTQSTSPPRRRLPLAHAPVVIVMTNAAATAATFKVAA